MAPAQKESTAPTQKRRRSIHPVAALIALALIGVGMSMIVNSGNARTETVQAQLSKHGYIPFSHQNLVDIHYADGSTDDVSADDSQSLFDAVDKFGTGTARVKRTVHGHSIRSIEFRGKTYEIIGADYGLAGGVIGVGLGLLILAWVILSFLFVPADDDPAPSPRTGAAA